MENIKTGRITLAITFISLGVIMFLDKFMGYNLKDLLFILWPIIIIVLGIEIISGNNLDILSISVIIIIVAVLALINFGAQLMRPNHRHKDEISEQIVTDENNKLIIDESNIDIEVTKSMDEKVRVKLEGIYEHDEQIKGIKLMSATKTEYGTVVTRPNKPESVYFKNINSEEIKYLVELPEGVNIDIISEYGDIMVREITGDIDIESEYGDVTLRLPKDPSGKFNIVATYGDIDDEVGFDIMESASTNSINETRKALSPVLNIRVENGDVILETN